MISPESITPSSLPSLPLEDRKQLPEKPCIYFAIDRNEVIQYIGRSVNLQQRWGQHHRHGQLKAMGDVKVAWLEVSDPSLLPEIEDAAIAHFEPPLNGRSHTGKVLKRISASIPDKLHDQLEALAVREGRSFSNLVSYLLEHGVDQRVQMYGQIQEAKGGQA